MRTLVVGGTRFIGRATVQALLSRGHDIMLLHRGHAPSPFGTGVGETFGDRNDEELVRRTMEDIRPDVVLDMIALGENDARIVARSAARVGAYVLLVSSIDVYQAFDILNGRAPGPPLVGPMTERAPLRSRMYPYRDVEGMPDVMQSYDKILAERALREECGEACGVLRLPMVYGPWDLQHRLAPLLKQMESDTLHISGRLARWRAARGYVHDIALLMTMMLEQRTPGIHHYAEQPVPDELTFARRVAAAIGWDGEIIVDERMDVDEGFVPEQHLDIDSTAVRIATGFHEVANVDEAIRTTVEWERGRSS